MDSTLQAAIRLGQGVAARSGMIGERGQRGQIDFQTSTDDELGKFFAKLGYQIRLSDVDFKKEEKKGENSMITTAISNANNNKIPLDQIAVGPIRGEGPIEGFGELQREMSIEELQQALVEAKRREDAERREEEAERRRLRLEAAERRKGRGSQAGGAPAATYYVTVTGNVLPITPINLRNSPPLAYYPAIDRRGLVIKLLSNGFSVATAATGPAPTGWGPHFNTEWYRNGTGSDILTKTGGYQQGGATWQEQVATLDPNTNCYSSGIGLTVNDCNEFVIRCVANERADAMEDGVCQAVLTNPLWFRGITNDIIQDMSPVVATRLLNNLHFKKIRGYDGQLKVESLREWRERLQAGTGFPAEFVNNKTDILANGPLRDYLLRVIAWINDNPAILNQGARASSTTHGRFGWLTGTDPKGNAYIEHKTYNVFDKTLRDIDELRQYVRDYNGQLMILIGDDGLASYRRTAGYVPLAVMYGGSRNFLTDQYKEYRSSVPSLEAIFDSLQLELKGLNKNLSTTSLSAIVNQLNNIKQQEQRLTKYLNYIERYNAIAQMKGDRTTETLEGTQIMAHVDKYNHILGKKAKGEDRVLVALEALANAVGKYSPSTGSRLGSRAYKP